MRLISKREIVFRSIRAGGDNSYTYVRMSYNAQQPTNINALLQFTERCFSITSDLSLPIIGMSLNIEIDSERWESNSPYDQSSIFQDVPIQYDIQNIEVKFDGRELCVCIETVNGDTLEFFSS